MTTYYRVHTKRGVVHEDPECLRLKQTHRRPMPVSKATVTAAGWRVHDCHDPFPRNTGPRGEYIAHRLARLANNTHDRPTQ